MCNLQYALWGKFKYPIWLKAMLDPLMIFHEVFVHHLLEQVFIIVPRNLDVGDGTKADLYSDDDPTQKII